MSTLAGELEEPMAGVLARAAHGDEAAFARIVREHHDDMSRVSFLICADLDVTDEAVQAAWSICWQKLGDVRDPSRLRSWLISIAANETRQMLRRRRRRTVVELAVSGGAAGAPDPADLAGDIDLVNALARLQPEDRALLALRYVAGFDSSELARATGRSASGTRARLARLLDRLEQELGDG